MKHGKCCSDGDKPLSLISEGCKHSCDKHPHDDPSKHEHPCCDRDDDALCLAVVDENGNSMFVYDADGDVRSFGYDGDIRKLCFSSHGHDADDLLTQCFDEEGKHGLPDEPCFCGVDTPHIHSHVHDPKTCNDHHKANDVSKLATLTLHVEDDDAAHHHKQHAIAISQALPNVCNSKKVREQLGKSDKHSQIHGKRLYPVKHDDHEDFLVHDKETGNLHLEHFCDSCDDHDYHGTIPLLDTREISNEETGGNNIRFHFFQVPPPKLNTFSITSLFEPNTSALVQAFRSEALSAFREALDDGDASGGSKCNRKKKVYRAPCCVDGTCADHGACSKSAVAPEPPAVVDEEPKGCCGSGGKCSSKVSTHDHKHDHGHKHGHGHKHVHESKGCRSSGGKCSSKASTHDHKHDHGHGHGHGHDLGHKHVHESKGCCNSGKCSKPKPVEEVPKSCCSGGKCSKSADDDHTITTIMPNDEANQASYMMDAVAKSTFICNAMCCSSEVLILKKIIAGVDGVTDCSFNVALRKILVDHDIRKASAQTIANALSAANFPSTIDTDGEDLIAQKAKRESVGRSVLFVEKICCASEVPVVNGIVKPFAGVERVSINTTNKLVYIDHDTSITTIDDIAGALNDARFGAHIKQDASTQLATQAATKSLVSSIFEISFGEANAMDGVSTALNNYLKTLPKTKVESFNLQKKMDGDDTEAKIGSLRIVVVHNPLTINANELKQVMTKKIGNGDATAPIISLARDGGDFVKWDFEENSKKADNDANRHADNDDDVKHEKATLRPTIIASGIFWIVSMLSFIGGDWEHLKYVALLSVFFGIPPIAAKAFQSIRRYQLDTNCLMFSASLGALALQEFTEAAAVTFLFALSEWLEVKATAKARNALSAIVRLRPDSANIIHPKTKEVIVVSARSVPVGAMVSVRTGDKFPCDGIVVEGASTVDESSLTGESRPVRKAPGDVISGGTVNSGSTQLVVQTTATSEDSAVSRLIRLVEEAQANRSGTEKLVDDFARVYTPVVVLSALLMCTIPWAFGRDTGMEWTHNGLVLLVVACPCALIISTPVSYVAGLAATAQRGVLVKGGAHLEALGQVRHICFDKTGTLTQGKFQLLHLSLIDDAKSPSEDPFARPLGREHILQVFACMEERASHPLAESIVQAVKNEGISIPDSMFVADHTFLAGEGVTGIIDNKRVHVGNLRMFERLGLLSALPEGRMNEAKEWEANGGTVGMMSIEGNGIVCSYCVADAIRPESEQVVRKLRKMGIAMTMLTGDNQDVANVIGKTVGLAPHETMGRLLPEEKLEFVEGLKYEYRGAKGTIDGDEDGAQNGGSFLTNLCSRPAQVLMCGDGVNDAPALATANIGVAMGAGAALAMETADVTLLDSNLEKLVYSIDMGRRVIRKIKENVVFSIAVKFVVLGFALAGQAALWAAIASDVGGMLIVTLNGLTLLPAKSPKENITKNAMKQGIDKLV